jgi:hypothetical protein
MDIILLWLTRILVFLIGCVFALFSSCKGGDTKLYTRNEILTILSERYGKEFVIVEKLKTTDFDTTWTVKSRFYAAAPTDDQEKIFWVYDEVKKYSGLYFPSYGHNSLQDTYAHDCFLQGFDTLTRERQLSCIYRYKDNTIDVSDHLSQQHLQGGEFCFFINQDNAEETVTAVFEICGELKEEFPLLNHQQFFLIVSFYDESETVIDGKKLLGGVYFSPCKPDYSSGEYATADSVLQKIFEMYEESQ